MSLQYGWCVRGAVLRAAVALAILTALFAGWGQAYTRGWCRVIEWQLSNVQDHFSAPTLQVVRLGDQTLLRLQAGVGARLRDRFPVIPAGEMVWGTTLAAYLQGHLILMMTLLAAWPAASLHGRCTLTLSGLAAAAVTTSLDLPFALTGVVLGEVYAALDPGLIRTDLLVRYSDFLQAGGRLLLPVVGAGLVVLGHSGPRPPPGNRPADLPPSRRLPT